MGIIRRCCSILAQGFYTLGKVGYTRNLSLRAIRKQLKHQDHLLEKYLHQNDDAPFDSRDDRENKKQLLSAIKNKSYRDFDAFMEDVLAHAALSDSPLRNERIKTFPEKKTLVEEFTVFCRSYTAMKEGDISETADRLARAYEDHEGNDREQLLTAFADEIFAIRGWSVGWS